MRSALQVTALAVVLSTIATAGPDASRPMIEKFKGNVTAVEMLGSRAASALVVDLDPRYVVTVDIASVVGTDARFHAGDRQAFAIHSPARMFGASDPIGHTFELELTGSVAHGRTTWRLAVKR